MCDSSDYESYPVVELDSDDDQQNSSSSDDELKVILHGTPGQRRHLKRVMLGDRHSTCSSSEDEFEKEMAAELRKTMDDLNKKHEITFPSTSKQLRNSRRTRSEKKSYDNVYFDSDSDDDMESSAKKSTKHPIISNDELLYDPDVDDENQKWIDHQRQQYQPKEDKPSNAAKPLPNSDAILNCPCCMSLLCLDCQRHATFKNQYRAMFVMNCRVDQSEKLHYPILNERSKKKKRSETESEPPPQHEKPEETFNGVRCEQCNTVVAVFDAEEVYHFFNVLSSYT